MPNSVKTEPRREKCPMCGREASAEHQPFCSPRCRDKDLLNWLGEGYRVAGPPADPDLPSDRDDGLDSDR
jgi:endogenous inhibitor of DNA gyrase (YacG/DUF329 family)